MFRRTIRFRIASLSSTSLKKVRLRSAARIHRSTSKTPASTLASPGGVGKEQRILWPSLSSAAPNSGKIAGRNQLSHSGNTAQSGRDATGSGGRLPPESAAGMDRNTHLIIRHPWSTRADTLRPLGNHGLDSPRSLGNSMGRVREMGGEKKEGRRPSASLTLSAVRFLLLLRPPLDRQRQADQTGPQQD